MSNCQTSHSNSSRQNTFNLCVQACSRARGLGNNSIFMSPWKWKWWFYWPPQSHDSTFPNVPVLSHKGKAIDSPFKQEQIPTFYFKLFDPAGLERILQFPWRTRVTRVQNCSASRQWSLPFERVLVCACSLCLSIKNMHWYHL